jgi:hypothetical protein
MDEVDQDRSAAGLRAPRRDLEISGRLVGGPDRRHPDDIADALVSQSRLQRPDLLMVAAVMPDQRLDAGLAHLGDQACRGLHRIRDRLLDQDVNAAPGAFDALLGMKLVGRGDDHGLRPRLVEQFPVVGEDRGPGIIGCDPIGVHVRDADEVIVVSLGKLREVLPPDQSRADDAYRDVLHLTSSVSGLGRRLRGDGLAATLRATDARAGASWR